MGKECSIWNPRRVLTHLQTWSWEGTNWAAVCHKIRWWKWIGNRKSAAKYPFPKSHRKALPAHIPIHLKQSSNRNILLLKSLHSLLPNQSMPQKTRQTLCSAWVNTRKPGRSIESQVEIRMEGKGMLLRRTNEKSSSVLLENLSIPTSFLTLWLHLESLGPYCSWPNSDPVARSSGRRQTLPPEKCWSKSKQSRRWCPPVWILFSQPRKQAF